MSNQNFSAALFSNGLYFKAFRFYCLSFKVKVGPCDVHILDIIRIAYTIRSGLKEGNERIGVASAVSFEIE